MYIIKIKVLKKEICLFSFIVIEILIYKKVLISV